MSVFKFVRYYFKTGVCKGFLRVWRAPSSPENFVTPVNKKLRGVYSREVYYFSVHPVHNQYCKGSFD